jgi:cell division protein FtsZ
MIEVIGKERTNQPKILVLGVGGGGNNAVNRMIAEGMTGVDFACVNTDADVLQECKSPIALQIGVNLTNGYGAGADPFVGEASAEENKEEIADIVSGYQMVILTCGMGGGTGTGAIPVISKLCRDKKILTVAVVTLPFTFEGIPKRKIAEEGIEKLKGNIDTLLVIPNDKLLKLSEKKLNLTNAFSFADSVLKYAISGITNIVYNQGMINLDFNDLRTTLYDKGAGHLGIGIVDKDTSVLDAVKMAIDSPLLDTSIQGASHIMINSSGDVDIMELNEAMQYIQELAGDDVNILWGTVTDTTADPEQITVTVIATGMHDNPVSTVKKPVKKESTPALTAPPKLKKEQNGDQIKIPEFLQRSSKQS